MSINSTFGRGATLAALAFLSTAAITFPASSQAADTVRVAIPLAFRGLDPHEGVNPRAEVSLQSNLYSSLTRITPKLEVVGDLATSWENPDPKTWIFKLNPKAKFQSGTALDAAMVVSNFQRMFDPQFTFASDLKPVFDKVEAVDPTTVRITLKTPYPDFLRRLSYAYFLDTEWAKTHNPKLESNASGPYILSKFDPESGATLTANPNYYGEAPAFKTAEMKVLGTPASRLQALQAGEIDVSMVIDPQDLKQLESNGNFKVGSIDSSRSVFLWFNTTKPPLDKQEVRQALNYAVNKDIITKALLQGLAKPLDGQVFSSVYEGHNPDLKAFPFDPAKAKDMLAKAGFPNGFTTDMSVPTGAYVAGDQIAQVVAGQLAQVGVKVTMNAMPMQTQTQQGNNAQTAAAMRFVGYAAYDMSSRGLLTFFRGAGASNQAKDPGFDKLYDAYLNAKDDAEGKALVKQITVRMNEFAPMLFLYAQPTTYAVAKNVDWVPRPDDWLRAFDMKPASK